MRQERMQTGMGTGDKNEKCRKRAFLRRLAGLLYALLLCVGIFSSSVLADGDDSAGETERAAALSPQAAAQTEKPEGDTQAQSEPQIQTSETETQAPETETESESDSQTETETETQENADQIILTCSGRDYQIKVTAGADAGISKDCTLTAREIDPDLDEYQQLSDRCQAALDRFEKEGTAQIPRKQIDADAIKLQKQEEKEEKEAEEGGPVTVTTDRQTLRFFDITILDKDKKEIEPAAAVQVEITLDSLKGLDKKENLTVVHDGDQKTDVMTGSDLQTDIKKDPAKGGSLSFQLDSFSTVAVTYNGGSAKVMIDPTNGGSLANNKMRGVYYYNGAALKNYSLNRSGSNGFALPTADQVTPPTAGYSVGYKLNGWYNVDRKEWLELGKWIDASVYNGTTFYADWIPTTYNIGSASNLAPTLDTNENNFITTHVFDYNDIYNARSCTFTSNNVIGDGRTIDWTQGNEPVLFDKTGQLTKEGEPPATLMCVANRKTDSQSKSWATQGLSYMIPNLFDPDRAWNKIGDDGSSRTINWKGVPGVTYVGDGNYLYQYDDSTGYYYYDSTKNAATYNRKENRFYVYNYTEMTARSANGDKSDFLPFNTGKNSYGYNDNTGGFETNYWFGMSSTVNFNLPNDVGAADSNGNKGNQSTHGDDMVYKFSGDDDVWVYVDDQLVLDMGGVHGVVSGEINFSTGKVTITPAPGDGTTYNIPDISNIKAGAHKLTIYYMERGASESNCSIYFNLAPDYSLTLTKKDKDTERVLSGAQFGVYLDEECTVPASLWQTDGDKNNRTYTFTTDASGQMKCSGLRAAHTYYLKELKPPAGGYPDISDAVIKLDIDSQGKAPVSALSGDYKWILEGNSSAISSEDPASTDKKGTFHLSLDVKNKKTTNVRINKVWKDDKGNTLTDTTGLSATFELWRKTKQGGTSGTSHTVTFRTQYFDLLPLINGNGTNMDVGFLKKGPETTVTVKDGSSVPFTAKALGADGNMGIYSVSANSQQLNGQMSDSTGDYKFLVNGSWVSLNRSGSYQLNNITKDTVVTVTFLGYLQYEGDTPSIAKSVSITPGTEIAGSSGGSGGGIDEKVADVPAAVLKDGNWSYLWKDLPVQDSYGNTYYYYVKEVSVPAGFRVNIDNNGGISGGTIAASNIKQTTQISVEKKWNDHDNIKHIRPTSVEISLYKDGTDTGKTLILSLDNDWKGSFTGLDKYEAGPDGREKLIEYTVKEKAVKGYTSYISQNGADAWLVTNSLLYELPNTGRSGTYPLIFCGCAMIAGALSLFRKDRKNKAPKGL